MKRWLLPFLMALSFSAPAFAQYEVGPPPLTLPPGLVDVAGVPTADMVAYWTDGDTITGDGNFSWDPVGQELGVVDINMFNMIMSTGTITDPQVNLNSLGIWNDAADTFVHWTMNITDTASAAASLLLRFNVDAGTVFSISKTGVIFAFNLDETGSLNLFVGSGAGDGAPGGDNTYIGQNAGLISSGDENVFIGSGAADTATTATGNVVIGQAAGSGGVWVGNNNVVVGRGAGQAMTTSDANVFVGDGAGGAVTLGDDNVLIGWEAGIALTAVSQLTAIGSEAGRSNTSGVQNVFVGYEAGNTLTTDSNNTFVGHLSGFAQNLSTGDNTYIGAAAGLNATTGAQNTFLGSSAAGVGVVTGNDNVVIGYQAGLAMTTAAGTTLIGSGAGAALTNQTKITMIGFQAGAALTSTAKENVFIGYQAGVNATTASRSVYIGAASVAGVASGVENTYIGFSAGGNNTTGFQNVAIGKSSGTSTTAGSRNTAIGSSSGNLVTEGTFNTAIGTEANQVVTTGDFNVFIGAEADTDNPDSQTRIALGYGAIATADNQAVFGSAHANGGITDMFLGQGVTKVSPSAFGLNVAGGSGLDNAAADWTFGGGRGTGTGAGGDLVFSTATPGSTSSTANALVERLRIDDTGLSAFTGRVSIAQGTIIDPALGVNHTVTWDDVTDTFTAYTLDVTDTNSAAGSLIAEWKSGGTAVVQISGKNLFEPIFLTSNTPQYSFVGDTDTGYAHSGANSLFMFVGGKFLSLKLVDGFTVGTGIGGYGLDETDSASGSPQLSMRWGGTGVYDFNHAYDTNDQTTSMGIATVVLSAMSGATVTASNLVPAGVMVVGVSIRVTTAVEGATTFTIGDGTDADRWGDLISIDVDTTTDIADFTIANPVYYTVATDVVLTGTGGSFTAGAVRITVHYIDIMPAGS